MNRFDAWMDAYGSWVERPHETFWRSAWRLTWSVTLAWFAVSSALSALLLWLT